MVNLVAGTDARTKHCSGVRICCILDLVWGGKWTGQCLISAFHETLPLSRQLPVNEMCWKPVKIEIFG